MMMMMMMMMVIVMVMMMMMVMVMTPRRFEHFHGQAGGPQDLGHHWRDSRWPWPVLPR
jgi:heme/copper-type cytochrome/quinol oxidase subunit 2